MKIYTLKKSMPGCPAGRLFKQNSGGEYFHSMTDDEAVSGELVDYRLPRNVVEYNPDWFVLRPENQDSTIQNPSENHDEKPWEI